MSHNSIIFSTIHYLINCFFVWWLHVFAAAKNSELWRIVYYCGTSKRVLISSTFFGLDGLHSRSKVTRN
jgi:tRNA U34 5-methylaminomethyl-2-thiouridine-forming methyltransferase MnmC